MLRCESVHMHCCGLVWCMVFNAIFNNISVTSWRSVLLVEETGVPGENHWPVASRWQTFWNSGLSKPYYWSWSNVCQVKVKSVLVILPKMVNFLSCLQKFSIVYFRRLLSLTSVSIRLFLFWRFCSWPLMYKCVKLWSFFWK